MIAAALPRWISSCHRGVRAGRSMMQRLLLFLALPLSLSCEAPTAEDCVGEGCEAASDPKWRMPTRDSFITPIADAGRSRDQNQAPPPAPDAQLDHTLVTDAVGPILADQMATMLDQSPAPIDRAQLIDLATISPDLCVPRSCEEVGAECGDIDDGCGARLSCGECPRGAQCDLLMANRCVFLDCPDPVCRPGVDCGLIDNGCGVLFDCRDLCAAPDSCGGGGEPNLCGCTPIRRCPEGAVGATEDGCGGVIDCGGVLACPNGYANCDQDPRTGRGGCEAQLYHEMGTRNAEHCGACGRRCAPEQPVCQRGSCIAR